MQVLEGGRPRARGQQGLGVRQLRLRAIDQSADGRTKLGERRGGEKNRDLNEMKSRKKEEIDAGSYFLKKRTPFAIATPNFFISALNYRQSETIAFAS